MAFAGRTSPGTDAGPTFAAPLEQIYRDQLQSLIRLLIGYVGVRAGAEDLAHDAFLRANSAWPKIEHGPRVDAYVRTIAINLALSVLRRQATAAHHQVHCLPDARSAESEVMLRSDRQRIAEAIKLLSVRQQQCVLLRYWDALPEAQIAERLGISRNSVKTHLRRGLEVLRRELGDDMREAS